MQERRQSKSIRPSAQSRPTPITHHSSPAHSQNTSVEADTDELLDTILENLNTPSDPVSTDEQASRCRKLTTSSTLRSTLGELGGPVSFPPTCSVPDELSDEPKRCASDLKLTQPDGPVPIVHPSVV